MGGYVYILASQKNGTLYIGSTTDIVRRLEQHRSGAVSSFSKKYGVLRLVHSEFFPDIVDARQRERQLKNWRRTWKIDLIEKDNPDWEDLTRSWNR